MDQSEEDAKTILWTLLLTGALIGLLRAVSQEVALFLVLWPGLSKGIALGEPCLAYGLDLTHTSFWALSFLGYLFEQEGSTGWASDGKGVVPA